MLVKSMWRRLLLFLLREIIMIVACVPGGISFVGNLPQFSYIDFLLLSILFCLMVVVEGFKQLRLLDFFSGTDFETVFFS